MDFTGFEQIIKRNFPLHTVSSMKTGGMAKLAFFPETKEQLCSLLGEINFDENTYVIGNSSNVLFPDDAGENTIIFTTKLSKITMTGENEFFALCGTTLYSLCNFAANNSLSGMEFAYGIPATVGGAVFMNAGAYEGEISKVVKSVLVYDIKSKSEYEIPCALCGFSYRKSIFQENRNLIILGATFVLSCGNREEICEKHKEFMQRRREKQPLDFPSCGSAFKRPHGYFAGKLIEDCNLKGFSVGGAKISEKHAGFVINYNNATSADVLELMRYVRDRVLEKFGVELCPEIEIIKGKDAR